MLRQADEIANEESPFSVADAICAAGWNEQTLVDAAGICAVANFFNRFVDGVGINVSSEHARRTGATLLPTAGFGGTADQLIHG
jgi:hypothetical protein